MLRSVRSKIMSVVAVALIVVALPSVALAAPVEKSAVLPIPLPGSIDGTVTSSLGALTAPVPGALVVALTYPIPPLPPLTSQNVSQTEQEAEAVAIGGGYVVTNQYGQYDITGLSPGTYAEFAFKTGYVPVSRFGVTVGSGQETEEDIQLQTILP